MSTLPRAFLLAAAFAVAACGDDAAKSGDATTTDTSGDSSGDTSATNNTDASGTDAAPDTIAGCEPGDGVTGTAGAEGLVLELCGARLEVPPDALLVPAEVGLKVVALPGPPPYEYEVAGPIIAVVTASDFTIPAQLFVPDTGAEGGYRMSAVYEPAVTSWLGFEACPTEGGVTFELISGGVYALFRDTVIFPESPQELGSGTLEATFQEVETTWDFTDGYAIHDMGSNGLRAVTLIARRTPEGGMLQQLDVRLSETADHAYAPLQVTLLDTADTSGGWSWLEPVHGPPAASSIIAVQGDRVVGTLTVLVHKGEAESGYMTIAIDVQTGRYRFPPEGICFPEG